LASTYTQTIDYGTGSDSTDYGDKKSEYLKQAEHYRKLWEKIMNVGDYAKDEDDEFGANIDNNQNGFIASKSLPISRRFNIFRPSYERKLPNFTSV